MFTGRRQHLCREVFLRAADARILSEKLIQSHSPCISMLRYGIPSYRLPRKRLEWDIEAILSAGVEVKLNSGVADEKSIKGLIDKYDAVYVAIGAHNYKMIGIEGEESNGVYSAVDLLREIGDAHLPDYEGKRVAVVGGGNVAMDILRFFQDTPYRFPERCAVACYRRLHSIAVPFQKDGASVTAYVSRHDNGIARSGAGSSQLGSCHYFTDSRRCYKYSIHLALPRDLGVAGNHMRSDF